MDLFAKLKTMKILLVDDDEWIRDSLRIFFEAEGCHIVALETAEEAMEYGMVDEVLTRTKQKK